MTRVSLDLQPNGIPPGHSKRQVSNHGRARTQPYGFRTVLLSGGLKFFASLPATARLWRACGGRWMPFARWKRALPGIWAAPDLCSDRTCEIMYLAQIDGHHGAPIAHVQTRSHEHRRCPGLLSMTSLHFTKKYYAAIVE
jgi:hypothetical protein